MPVSAFASIQRVPCLAEPVLNDTSHRNAQMNRPSRTALILSIAILASTFASASPVVAAVDRATMALESSRPR
jgi:hypothetical protein